METLDNKLLEAVGSTDIDKQFEDALAEYAETALYGASNQKREYTGKDILIANLPQVYDMIVKGETVSHICKTLGISRMTWYNTANSSKHFQLFIKNAEQEQIAQVKKTLVTKCADRYIQREKVLPNGKIVQYEDFLPADINAVKFYLLNKASDEFKEKQEIVVRNTEIVVDIVETDYEVVTEEEPSK